MQRVFGSGKCYVSPRCAVKLLLHLKIEIPVQLMFQHITPRVHGVRYTPHDQWGVSIFGLFGHNSSYFQASGVLKMNSFRSGEQNASGEIEIGDF